MNHKNLPVAMIVMVSITKCLCSGDLISRNVFSISSLKPISVESMSDSVGSAGKMRLAIRIPPTVEIYRYVPPYFKIKTT